MDKKLFDIPVLLITFNRPETTCLVFEQIRKLRPSHLYLFSDAPRKDMPEDNDLVEACRYLLNDSEIDWDCKVERWFPETNMGCALGICSAITWAFETCSQLIIVEDDCLPHPDFFTFCKFMLDMYRGNDRIMHISGTLMNEEAKESNSDHFFSLIGNTGGWATWKRAWNKYDFWMEQLPEMKSQKRMQSLIRNENTLKYWLDRFDAVYAEEKKQNWEVQWQYTLFKNYALAVVPNTNLISSIDYMAGASL
ncbi:hypothetical protein [Dyadobacter pollutisoli]|uniref:Nucleotide-diphospho-sugar transferase n=1 Tax=Dyadobacter pollutisoli TaxID=2910158 RepID=A0A9E8NEM0_9BACT|nr:hypothetical protein [Dyadobacter pollutisoli]WAC15320.1 hypothetical protein ON006_15405 [Dyadobacter pollutisoli]